MPHDRKTLSEIASEPIFNADPHPARTGLILDGLRELGSAKMELAGDGCLPQVGSAMLALCPSTSSQLCSVRSAKLSPSACGSSDGIMVSALADHLANQPLLRF